MFGGQQVAKYTGRSYHKSIEIGRFVRFNDLLRNLRYGSLDALSGSIHGK